MLHLVVELTLLLAMTNDNPTPVTECKREAVAVSKRVAGRRRCGGLVPHRRLRATTTKRPEKR